MSPPVFSDTFILVAALAGTAARSITGDATNDLILGAAGNDLLSGGEGDDRLDGLAGADQLTGGRGQDVLNGGDDNDTLTGGAGDDVLDGGAGIDVIDGGAGNDVVVGGAGIDTVTFAGATAVTVDLAGGWARGLGSDVISGVENVIGSSAGDRIRGDGGDNIIDGGAGQDTVWGGGGRDTISGGQGNAGGARDLVKSSYVFNGDRTTAVSLDPYFDLATRSDIQSSGNAHATVRATAFGGLEYYAFTVTQDQIVTLDIDEASFDTTLRVFNAQGVELASNDDGTYAGDGGGSTDSYLQFRAMTPGTYYVQVGQWSEASTGFATRSTPAGGVYTLHVSGVVHASVDRLAIGSTLFGEDGDDVLTSFQSSAWLDGGNGNDRLLGGAGSILRGGAGNDELRVDQPGATAVFSGVSTDYVIARANDIGQYRITGADGSDLFSGISFLRFDDRTVRMNYYAGVITGTSGADALTANFPQNTLVGGGGADTLAGGQGVTAFRYLATSDSTSAAYDTLLYFEAGTDYVDIEALNPTSISLVRSGNSTFVFAETAQGGFQTLALNARLTGDDVYFNGPFGVFMTGTSASDILRGSYRPDSIVGGDGDDIITGGRGGDALSGGTGVDIFRYLWTEDSSAADGVDNLYDFETGVDVIDLTPIMATSISIIRSDNGSSFVFAETPLGGFLTSAAGRAINGSDFHYGGGFGIYMVGSGNSDILTGTSLADPIAGGGGDDIIIGGGGADALFGDAGADLFVYRSVLDSMEGASDGIFGFVSGQDRIDLSGLRNSAADVFGIAYLGGGSFLFVDVGGDGYNELVIQLANTTLLASDINWGSAPPSSAPTGSVTGGIGLTAFDDEGMEMAGWSPPIGRTGGTMDDLGTVWAHGRHGPDWYL